MPLVRPTPRSMNLTRLKRPISFMKPLKRAKTIKEYEIINS